MWLINVSTLDLEEFNSADIPPYCILSHTWGLDEVTFALMKKAKRRPEAERMAGYFKIQGCCKQAKKDGLKYAWIDSCCIDKSSSAELSEALNSMFQWYKLAAKCYVYLTDVLSDEKMRGQMLGKSRWFTRGWTLQELLAPQEIVFFANDWTTIGYKTSIAAKDQGSDETRVDLTKEMSRITEIPIEYLVGKKAIGQACLAQRMYWAARRETTRAEDRAYSLMGLFDINMPILYGEGLEKAFNRLQREIIHRSPDQSILAWYKTHASSHRLLAESPDCFQNSGTVIQMGRSQSLAFDRSSNWSCFVMTNLGLQITLPLVTKQSRWQFRYGDGAKAALHCVEGSIDGPQGRICLDLVFLNNDLDGRPVFMCHRLRRWTLGDDSGTPTNMYLCSNDYISALAEQKIVRVAEEEAPESITSRFMDILADEAGLSKNELSDDMLFFDIGVDSLLMLIISARVQGELDRNTGIDTFVQYPSIGTFKGYLSLIRQKYN